jgi:membrane protein required for colicin V production
VQNFEAIDYIFITIALLSALFGFARGFLKEVFSLLTMFLASAATYYCFPHAYEFFFKHINNESIVLVLCTFFMYGIFWFIISYFTKKLAGSIGVFGNNFADKILGTGFGLLRGILFVIVIYMSIVITFHAYEDDSKMPEWMLNAKSHNFVKMQTEYFLKFMPESVQKVYKEGTDEPMGMLFDSLSKKAPVTEFEKKLATSGLTMDNIKTLRQVAKDMPISFKHPHTLPEIADLDKAEQQEYVTKLINDYKQEVKLGNIKSELSEKALESLQDKIENITPADGVDDSGVY